METHERRNIDLLVNRFWKQGFFTVNRKYSSYLPEPDKIGVFDVDVVARLRNKYAIGITINKNDLINNLQEKIVYLATRHTRKTNELVQLYIGVPNIYLKQVKSIINLLTLEVQQNIKIINIPPEVDPIKKPSHKSQNLLFS
jgi:hypothetical protein